MWRRPKKSAAEAEAQRVRGFGLAADRGVVETEFFERFFQVVVLVGVDRIDAAENHRLHFFEAAERFFGAGFTSVHDRVADFHVAHVSDAANDRADFAAGDLH